MLYSHETREYQGVQQKSGLTISQSVITYAISCFTQFVLNKPDQLEFYMHTPRRLALLMDMNDFYNRKIAAGVWQFVRNHKEWICESISPAGVLGKKADWSWLPEGKWDGIVTYTFDDSLIAFLEKCKIPAVNVSNAMPLASKIPRVVSDDYAVGKMAAEHFLERGLRNFAFFGVLGNALVSTLRVRGFEDTLKEAGFGCELLWPDFQMEKGRWMRTEIPEMEKRVAEGCCPLGIFCVNDVYARHLISCCVAHRIDVPEQVAVLGVHNSEIADGLAEIPFSSVELQLEKIGYTATEYLSTVIEKRKPPQTPILIPPQRVVVRVSSDLMAINDDAVARSIRLIRENAFKPLQMEDIVRKVGLSRRMFEKRFKAAVGRAPYAEVIRLRVEKARMLLAETNLRISEVASESGFGEGKHLHAIFTREVGVTPSLFRRKFQKPQ